ncbi:hypothetical protein GOACH_05_03400 [Gordonia aichiensis NBRC 108223]|uniref:Permease n=2 Tax=Gordonia aichiensis TaxID=36820 RepID=L7KJ26_9ACTN|nr:hypothetical protein GOACH_05_03400 [Gordonia aichiensis NBRC 108223]
MRRDIQATPPLIRVRSPYAEGMAEHPEDPAPVSSSTPEPDRRTEVPVSTTSAEPQPTFSDRLARGARKFLFIAIAVVIAVIVYFVLAAFLPRWWGEQIGRNVDGSMGRGIGSGLSIGFVCTFIPISLLVLAVAFRGKMKNIVSIVCVVAGVVVAIPNLLTLSIQVGDNNAAHAGKQILNVRAPGFRAASAWGVIIAVVVAILLTIFVVMYRRRGKKLNQANGDVPKKRRAKK